MNFILMLLLRMELPVPTRRYTTNERTSARWDVLQWWRQNLGPYGCIGDYEASSTEPASLDVSRSPWQRDQYA